MRDYKRLKDPIYGYINIPMNYMMDIVDTAAFQRLRRIIQTSYSPLYSSAVHNRFVHSLGVFYLGSIAAEALVSELKTFSSDISEEKLYHIRDIFLLACLLHDVGHAPFSHTGEDFYLDGEGENRYEKIQQELVQLIDTESYSLDVPANASGSAAAHEIMSAIVGIRRFPDYFKNAEDKELFARCITGYQYSGKSEEGAIKNCFISLLNSQVIDVDKLDYLIRDAYITGFDTVNIDYERLLKALTITEDYKLAYYKDAVSVIENVVYARDAERKWIQNHPIVLYECYILKHVFKYLSEQLDIEGHKLFSYESLTEEGHVLNNNIKVSLMSDDDIVYIMKNVFPCKMGDEYFQRCERRHPLWKSESEYEALFSGAIGGKNDSIIQFEMAMQKTASYLAKTTDNWVITEETVKKIKDDLDKLDGLTLDELSKETQRKDKNAALELMQYLLDYAKQHNHPGDFIVLEASQFNSGFGKQDFSEMPIIFITSPDNYVVAKFGDVAKPLHAKGPERNKFYYLFYRRKGTSDNQIDKADLCAYLTRKYATLTTHTRKKRV